MYFRQFYLGCLAHASYFISSAGEAVVVDPQRDVGQYLAEAAAQRATVKYILETHLHADFVSGHLELAEATGAEVVFGAGAGAAFPHRAVADGDLLSIGHVSLRALATPGHTPESVCWLVENTAAPGDAKRLLTGDTLFIGDVGRPDLAGGKGYTAPQMASMLYDSLHRKILALDDSVEVWPAHGAGSACGRNISKERSSTIGAQRRMNYALQPMSREDFVALMTTDLPPAPRYFAMDAEINRRGARPLSEVSVRTLTPRQVKREIESGASVLDTRTASSFGVAHLPGSVNIGLDGEYASWAGSIFPAETRLVLVAGSENAAAEGVLRLARVGLENVVGWLAGGVDAWREAGFEVASIAQLTIAELRARMADLSVIDVRRVSEHRAGHVPGALNLPLETIETAASLESDKPIAVICAGGYRSSIAASLLRRKSVDVRYNVSGGTSAWIAAGYPTVPPLA